MTAHRFGRATVSAPDGQKLTLTFTGEAPDDYTEHAALLLHQGADATRPAAGSETAPAGSGETLVDVATLESDPQIRYFLDGRRIGSETALEHIANGVVHVLRIGLHNLRQRGLLTADSDDNDNDDSDDTDGTDDSAESGNNDAIA